MWLRVPNTSTASLYPPTPSQLQFAADHAARLQRMGGRRKDVARPGPLSRPVEAVAPVEAPGPSQPFWFWVLDEIDPAEPSTPKISLIQKIVCQHFDISHAEMISPQRNAPLVRVRQIAMFLAKEMAARSLPEIGLRFGGRDHTTALHSVRKIERLALADGDLSNELNVLRAKIKRASR